MGLNQNLKMKVTQETANNINFGNKKLNQYSEE